MGLRRLRQIQDTGQTAFAGALATTRSRSGAAGDALRARLAVQRTPCASEPELLDLPGIDPATLAENLSDLQRINRLGGGVQLALRGLARLGRDWSPGTRVVIADIGTGAGDIPRAVEAWGARRSLSIATIGIDTRLDVLQAGAAAWSGWAVVADGRRLPLPDRAVDVATCSLVMHHLDPDDAVVFLAEMRRVSRRGIVVNDLIRTRHGLIGAYVWSYLTTRNPLSRHDGPLGVRRAYTLAELGELAASAGLAAPTFDRFLGYRVAMTLAIDA